MDLIFSPILPNDIDFLKTVYFDIRSQEISQMVTWTEGMKNDFLEQQFWAQHNYYQQNYPRADFLIIKNNNDKVGRLYIDYNFEQNIRIIDIAILSNFRNKGMGQQVLNNILEKAKSQKKKVTIHVESFNSAKNLYVRLGFKKVSETNGVYHLYEWEQ